MNSYENLTEYTSKILALDIGDQWIGSALSDPLGLTAKPFKTVTAQELTAFITKTIHQEQIKDIVIGYPLTLRGTKSEQTKIIISTKEELEKKFPLISWHLWDERLTSKRAESLKKAKTREEKLHAHSIAAAFILQSYLDYLAHKKAI
jgi:putative pre-16S rRNA nuclease